MRILIFFFIHVFCLTSLLGNDDFLYQDYVYNSNIKTVQFKGVSNQTSNFPIIQLNKGTLYFSFDDLSVDAKEYTYRIIHCDRNWQPSALDREEYLEGFDFEEIRDYRFSQNTYVEYVHYDLTLPNKYYKWTISGNYLLVVYEGDERDGVPVITRRFMVSEQAVDIGAKMKSPIRVDKMKTHHELDLNINYRNFNISEPKREVFVHVLQNGNWNNGIYNLNPNYMSRGVMVFNFNDKITFPALKEHRNFDIRNLNFATQWVHSIDLHNEGADVLLKLAEPRTYNYYHTRPDINGSFYVSDDDDDIFSNRVDVDVLADYAYVIFTLKMEPLDNGLEVYPVGSFSGWMPLPELRMTYDFKRNAYVGESLFKQGFYDYMYAVVDEKSIDLVALEGSSYETGNDYNILVYLSEFSGRYDRLIGVKTVNSNNQY